MLATVVLGLLLFSCWWYLRRPAGLPPGPVRFPLVGSPHVYMGDLRKQLTDLRKHYGDVTTVYFGETIVVVLNGVKTIKDAFKMQVFSERPDSFSQKEMFKRRGITNSPNWKLLRGLVLKSLKETAVGRSAIDSKIREELDLFVHYLSTYNGQSFDPSVLIHNLTFNIICSIVLGKRVFSSDEDFERYNQKVKACFKASAALNLLTPFPWLRFLPGDLFGFHKAIAYYKDTLSFHESLWAEHTQTYGEQGPENLMDSFKIEQEKLRSREGTQHILERDLAVTINDVILGGTETTAANLRWAIVFLMRHPEVQRELQEEVDRYLGNDGMPTYSMRQNMTKMEAFGLECLRLSDVVPFCLPHASRDNATINGYKIPKGTTILANLHGVLYDPEIWGDPEVFRPWRFLTEDGKINNDLAVCLIPFSTGKRQCVGEALAQKELFLISSRLLQKFSFYPPDGCNPLLIEGELHLTFAPKPYQVLVKSRVTH